MSSKRKDIILYMTMIFGLLCILFIFLFYKDGKERFYEKYDLEGLTVEEIVGKLDSSIEDSGFKASIKAQELIIEDGNTKIRLEVPENLFYISMAPYIESIHPCGNHSLVTCRGEIKNELFDVLIKNNDGETIYSKQVKSMDNGFIGVWLPSNINGAITVQYNGLKAETTFSTSPLGNTCITTPLKLT